MRIHTVVVDGPLALRMRRLDAAREGATGRKILTLPLLAARLAGGFVVPATQEILCSRITQTEAANGFANRFLFVLVRRSKLLPHGGNLDQAQTERLADLMKAAVAFAKRVGRVEMTEAARRQWEAIYCHLSAEQPGMLGALRRGRRLRPFVLR
jgi:hypothetical protein